MIDGRVERRAVEPVIPLHLFANRVFSAASAIGFVVGFAMFGALTFLPLFFQIVKGVSPTASGLRLFPMMGGLLVASIGSGIIVSRWGRYKVFPVVGTALMTIGRFLMSHIGVATSEAAIASFMVVFGLGLGLVMQVLVVSVQNAVSYEELGTATSGVTFFRMIGGSFGTAVFGAIFANLLVGNLATQLAKHGVSSIPGGAAGQIDNPALIAKLPPAIHHAVSVAIADTIDRVRPVLDAIGSLTVRMGPFGAGLTAKLARNLIQYGSWLAAYEGLLLAEAAGVELAKLAQVIKASDKLIAL